MLDNTVLVSAVGRHESATGMHMSPPLAPPSPLHLISPPRSSRSAGLELPASYSDFPLAVYFTHGNVHDSVLLSQLAPPSPHPTVSTSLFFMSSSPWPPRQ